jgi:hypothetical protein
MPHAHLVLLQFLISPPKLLDHWHDESEGLSRACACIDCYILMPTEQGYGGLLYWCRGFETQGRQHPECGFTDAAQLVERPQLGHVVAK